MFRITFLLLFVFLLIGCNNTGDQILNEYDACYNRLEEYYSNIKSKDNMSIAEAKEYLIDIENISRDMVAAAVKMKKEYNWDTGNKLSPNQLKREQQILDKFNGLYSKMQMYAQNQIQKYSSRISSIKEALTESDFFAKNKQPDYDVIIEDYKIISSNQNETVINVLFKYKVMEYNSTITCIGQLNNIEIKELKVNSTKLFPVGKWYDMSGSYERTFEIMDNGTFAITENSQNNERINLTGTWEFTSVTNQLILSFPQLKKEFKVIVQTKIPENDGDDRFCFFNLQDMTFINI